MPFAPRDTFLECRIALRFLMTTKSLQSYCFFITYTNRAPFSPNSRIKTVIQQRENNPILATRSA